MQLRPVTMSLKKASMLRGNTFLKSGDKRQQAIERTTNAVVPAPDAKTIPTSRFQCRNRLRAKPITNATTPGMQKPPTIAYFTQRGGLLPEGRNLGLRKARRPIMYTKKPATM